MAKVKTPTEIYPKGQGRVKLSNQHFIAQGGEGSVWGIGTTAYKIYLDIKKVIPDGKIQEISVLGSNPHILIPKLMILDKNNRPIGYTMDRLPKSHPLCKIFTNGFRKREGITPQITVDLVRDFQNKIQFIHQNDILIVDLNEMNFLMDEKFKSVLFIDVNSYQTTHFPATAIMSSIKDRHMKKGAFSELTDWFAFGIVSFQMFVGIHPFRGSHPNYKYPPQEREMELDARMLANVSVLDPKTKYPKGPCRDISSIPQAYLEWYQAIFDGGKRVSPPDTLQPIIIIPTKITKISGTNKFEITEFLTVDGDFVEYLSIQGTHAQLTTEKVYVTAKNVPIPAPGSRLGITPKMGYVVSAWINNGMLNLKNITLSQDIDVTISADQVMSYQGRLYVKTGGSIIEIKFIEIGNVVKASPAVVGNALEIATEFYEGGVVIQNLIGAYYVSLLPRSGACYQIRLPELDEHRIIEAKFDNQVMIVIASKDNKYNKFVFRFSEEFDSYTCRLIQDVQYSGINFVVLDNGVCVHINEQAQMEVFTNKPESKNLTLIEDPILQDDIRLFKDGIQVLFANKNVMYRMKMKTK